MQDKKSRGSKPSSVLGGHLSRPDGPAASSPQRLLSTFGLGEPPSLSAGSEIAAGRIALFTRLDRRQDAPVAWSLLLSRARGRVPIWTVGAVATPPRLDTGHPALCSSDFPLAPGGTSDHPSPLSWCFQASPRPKAEARLSTNRPRLRRGRCDSAEGETRTPMGYCPLRPERSASAISPLRPGADHRTRTDDLLFTKQLLYQLS